MTPEKWMIQIGNLPFSMDNIIALAALLVSAGGLLFVILQLHQIARQNRFGALQARYSLIFHVQKFCFENPEYFEYWTGGTRYQRMIEAGLDKEEWRKLAGKDVIMDTLEYLFLSGQFSSREHELDFVRRLIRNPKIREYLASPLCGSFTKHFQDVIDKELRDTKPL